jgi:cytochrome c biogenesis protein CcmG/thiol:disulfide interchange protein DsbE
VNPKNRTPLIIGGVVVLIVVLAGLAVLLTGGDDDSPSSDLGPVPTYSDAAEQIRPVSFEGDPLPGFVDAASDPAVGVAAPVVDGQDFDGAPITLGGAADGPTLLVFLAHYCPHCNAEIPEILDAYGEGLLPTDLEIVGISTNAHPDGPNYPPSEWVADKGWIWPTMADDAATTAMGVFGGPAFPYMVLLDEDGNVVARRTGELGADALGAWVTENLAAAAA